MRNTLNASAEPAAFIAHDAPHATVALGTPSAIGSGPAPPRRHRSHHGGFIFAEYSHRRRRRRKAPGAGYFGDPVPLCGSPPGTGATHPGPPQACPYGAAGSGPGHWADRARATRLVAKPASVNTPAGRPRCVATTPMELRIAPLGNQWCAGVTLVRAHVRTWWTIGRTHAVAASFTLRRATGCTRRHAEGAGGGSKRLRDGCRGRERRRRGPARRTVAVA